MKTDVAEGVLTAKYWTSVGEAFKLKIDQRYGQQSADREYDIVSSEQVIELLDYSQLYDAEDWALVEKNGQYFFDPLDAGLVPLELSEVRKAVSKVEEKQ